MKKLLLLTTLLLLIPITMLPINVVKKTKTNRFRILFFLKENTDIEYKEINQENQPVIKSTETNGFYIPFVFGEVLSQTKVFEYDESNQGKDQKNNIQVIVTTE